MQVEQPTSFYTFITSGRFLPPRQGTSSGWWLTRPRDMEDNCEHGDWAIADSRQGVTIQPGTSKFTVEYNRTSQNITQCLGLLFDVVNFALPKIRGIYRLLESLLPSERGLCFRELVKVLHHLHMTCTYVESKFKAPNIPSFLKHHPSTVHQQPAAVNGFIYYYIYI